MSILRNLVIVMGASIVCTSAPAALVNLGDGTVKDEASNLIWLKDWDQLGADTWFNQSAAVDALAFAGSSDWRLPTIDEYLALWAQVGSTTAGLQSHFDDVQPTSINDIRLFHWSSEPVPAPPASFAGLYFAFRMYSHDAGLLIPKMPTQISPAHARTHRAAVTTARLAYRAQAIHTGWITKVVNPNAVARLLQVML